MVTAIVPASTAAPSQAATPRPRSVGNAPPRSEMWVDSASASTSTSTSRRDAVRAVRRERLGAAVDLSVTYQLLADGQSTNSA
jgi:hypothetical protein